MPGDTLNLNSKTAAQNRYDAVVIGSGISGGWAAKELTEKGTTVWILERGRDPEHLKAYKTGGIKARKLFCSSSDDFRLLFISHD